MVKKTYSRILIILAFAALMLALPAQLRASLMDSNQTGIRGMHQSEAPGLMAQATENRSSVTTVTEEASPEESGSVTSTTKTITEEAQPLREERRSVTSTTTTAEPPQKPDCAGQCRGQYDRSMTECSQPGHPDKKDCKKWARGREKDCLENCYRR